MTFVASSSSSSPRARALWAAPLVVVFLVSCVVDRTMMLNVNAFSPSVHSSASIGRVAVAVSRRATVRTRLEQSSIAADSNAGDSGGGGGASSAWDASMVVPPLRRHPPRRVCLMVEPTPFTHVSGYANRFQEMLRYMKKAGDAVDILTVDSKTKPSKLPKQFLGFNIRHTQGFTFPLYNQISLSLDLPEMKGARILEKFKPELIHVTSPGFMLFAAIFYARTMCIPLVMSYHTHLPSYGKNYLGFLPGIEHICWDLLRWAHSRADLTLVTSPQMKQELLLNGIPRVEVWRKGIDTVRFHPKFKNKANMRQRLTQNNVDDFLMIYVGRLGAEKRLKDIKPMLAKLPTNTRLAIVGKGPQEDELKQWFKGTNTVFMGQLSGDELSAAFASADVFCMPSDSETLGFVVLESMASGVTVVGANAGGIPGIIDHAKTGYLVEPGDIDGFVQQLDRLAKDKRLRKQMGKASRQEAERWGWEAATSYLRNVQYEKAMINFHSRAFGGFGRPRTAGAFRLFGWRVRRVLGKITNTPRTIFNWFKRDSSTSNTLTSLSFSSRFPFLSRLLGTARRSLFGRTTSASATITGGGIGGGVPKVNSTEA